MKKENNKKMKESSKKGHRIHVTMNTSSEPWPAWGRWVVGIAGGFIHFESEDDFLNYEPEPYVIKEENRETEEDGRCVSECGPIGFKAA
jgi:hypothetical protein